MIFVYKDRIIQIEWIIFRGTSQVPEDFSRALVKLFLVGNYEKYAVPVTAEGGTLVAQMPQDLPDGAYSLEAIWVKNYNNLFPVRGTDTPSVGAKNIRYPGTCHNAYGMLHPWDHRSNDRCLMRSRKEYVFAVTSYQGEETAVNEDGSVTIRISSAVATYGYDGLSAYELAVMRGDFNGSEGEWIVWTNKQILDKVSGLINYVHLEWKGSPYLTRISVPTAMRKKGLIVNYELPDGNVCSEKNIEGISEDERWGLDSSWTSVYDINLTGDVSVSPEGNWIINGEDTGVKAVGPQGDPGSTIIPRFNAENDTVEYSWDNVTWHEMFSLNEIRPTVSVGKVVSLENGENARVENTGTANNVIFDFYIPEGKTGQAPLLRWYNNRIEQSIDKGKTWSAVSDKFDNHLYIKGYVSSSSSLPKNALIGDIYGVGPTYDSSDSEHTKPYYQLYVNTVSSWTLNYTITTTYLSDEELPSVADENVIVLVKKSTDSYLVYKYSNSSWVLLANLAEIYVESDDIVNRGDNVYALVQSETENQYLLYKRNVSWVNFGTYNSIQAGIVQETGNSENTVMSQKSVTKEVTNLNANTGVSEYPLFSESEDYAEGESVLYSDGFIYTFTKKHPAGAWTTTDVTRISIRKYVDKKITELEKLNFNFLQSTTFPNITQYGNNVSISNHIYLFIGKPLIYINMPNKTIDLGTPIGGIRNIVLLEIDEYKDAFETTESDTFCRYVVVNGNLTSLDGNKYYLPLFYYDDSYKIYYLNKIINDFNVANKIGTLGILNASQSIPTSDIIVSEKYMDEEGFEKVDVTIPDVFPNSSVLDIYTGQFNYGENTVSGTYKVPYAYGMLALCCNESNFKVEVFNLASAQSSDSLFIKNKYPLFDGYSITPLLLIYRGSIVYNTFLNINQRYEKDLKDINYYLGEFTSSDKIAIDFKTGVILSGKVDFTVNSSPNWVYTIVPIENILSIKTYAGGVNNTTGAYAVHFMRNEELIADNYISSYSSSNDGGDIVLSSFALKDIEIPLDAKYVVINCFAANKEEAEVYSIIFASPYVVKKIEDIEATIGATSTPNTFIVRKTPNSGEYGTIQEALNQAKEYDSIIIYEGVYEEKHLHIPKGLKMEGIGEVEIRGKYPESTDAATVTANSTLECNKGATLKNLIITAQNMRYPIHADFSYGAKANWDIRNCKFIHYGNKEVYDYMTSQGQETNGTLFTACSAWGGGTYGGDTVYCEDCYFESVGRAFSTHNNVGDTYTNIGPSKVKLVNCELVSKGIDIDGTQAGLLASLFVQSLDCPVDCEVTLSNCKINGYVVRQNSGGNGWSNTLKLYSCGNQKIAFSSYGSGQNFLKDGNQTATYQLHYDKYNIDDTVNSYINIGESAIAKGQAVKKSSYGIALKTSQDDSSLFGIALDDIPINGCGHIHEAKGYIHRIYLNGIRTTNISEYADIYLTESGDFSLIGTVKVLKGVDNQNCIFVE